MSQKKDIEYRKAQATKVHNNKYDYSKWDQDASMDDHVIIICPFHGEFTQLMSNHIRRKSSCPECAKESRRRKRRKSEEDVNNILMSRGLKMIEVYQGSHARYTFECCEGHQWQAKFNEVAKGHGCPKCAVRARKRTMRERYGYEHYTQQHLSEETQTLLNDRNFLQGEHEGGKTLQQISIDLGVTPKVIKHRFEKFGIKHNRFSNSQAERDIVDYIQRIIPNEDIIINDRELIHPQELDIVIPSLKIAIEINGVFWHSELNGKKRNYHLNKTKLCESKGYRLVHILDQEWIKKTDIVRGRLRNLLGCSNKIYARKCYIINVTSSTARQFLEQTHIQGYGSSSINLGLMYENELVALMTFGKGRYNKKVQYELIRYSSKLGVSVVGGASKLFKYFISEYQPESIVSYSDKRWNTGLLYKNLGFKFQHTSYPNYFYFKINDPTILYPRVKFQKHKLPKVLDFFDPDKTEWENMVVNGYDRIWDCGNDVWHWYN